MGDTANVIATAVVAKAVSADLRPLFDDLLVGILDVNTATTFQGPDVIDSNTVQLNIEDH
jgi:hypothetical protein